MDSEKPVFLSSKGLNDIVRGDLRNEYVMYTGRGAESDNNPLPMLTYRKPAKYFLKFDESGLIIAAATLYPYAKGTDERYPDADFMYLSQVGVRREHRGKGYAKRLLGSVFMLAARTDSVLVMSSFEPDGRKYLAPVLPVLHKDYPTVKVVYDGMKTSVTGEKDYKLVLDWSKPPVQPL